MSGTDDPRGPSDRGGGASYPVRVDEVYVDGFDGRVSLLHLATVLIKHRRAVIGLPVAFAVIFVLIALVLPARYTSWASFIPESSGSQATRLAGLASQFGFGLQSADPGQGPDFYAQLLRSHRVRAEAARTEYRLSAPADAEPRIVKLADAFRARGADEARRIEDAARRLNRRLRVETDGTTGIVTLSVRTRDPELSRQIVSRLLALINQFDLESRKTRAARERAFVEQRVAEVGRELIVAEDSLESFIGRNRRIENSPELQFEQDRLRGRVDVKRQVYTSLAQEYEQAKIDEVRDTPVITVIDGPVRPLRSDPRRLPLLAAFGLFVGALAGVLVAALREFAGGLRSRRPDDYAEFARVSGAAGEDLRGLVGRLRGRLPWAGGGRSDRSGRV